MVSLSGQGGGVQDQVMKIAIGQEDSRTYEDEGERGGEREGGVAVGSYVRQDIFEDET